MAEEHVRKAVEKREHEIELPRLTLEDKWEVARGNIIYFVVSGITYAKPKMDRLKSSALMAATLLFRFGGLEQPG